MSLNRRNFITALTGSIAATIPLQIYGNGLEKKTLPTTDVLEKLDMALSRKVLKTEYFTNPVIIESIDLMEYKGNFICRVRSKDGAEGFSFANSQMDTSYTIFTKRIKPFFIGKDARDLEELIEGVYVHESNYKLQSVAYWVPLATLEFAILDMLGRMANKTMGLLVSDKIYNPEISFYQANSKRGISAEETVEQLHKQLEKSQAKAIKFKIGGRMSDPEIPKNRTEKLIPLVRETFGDNMVLFVDSNGSYDVPEAIRIGKILEEYKYDFYEEPVPFDWYEETRQVAEALNIKIAGGEQEPSLRNFRWLIANNALQIVQADLFYFGGMIQCIKIARMAEALGLVHIPHVSNIGYVYTLQFVSAIPNAGAFHEFKSPFDDNMEFECKTSTLLPKDGIVKVPTGPGMGIEFAPEFIKKHRIIL